MRSPSSAVLLIALLFASAAPVLADKPDETAIQNLWNAQQKDATAHAALIQAAAAFEQQFPSSPLVPVARGFAAWHMLESGDLDNAKQLLEKMASSEADPVAAIGAEMARRWLTRLDREQVVAALQKIYAEDLEYPASLSPIAALGADDRPPMADRWGASWLYSPAAFKELQTGDNQTFDLQSGHLGTNSDLKAALALPYGAGFTYKPAQVLPAIAGKAVIMFQDAAGHQVTVAEGSASSDLGLAYVGDQVLILSTGDYWSIQPRPSS